MFCVFSSSVLDVRTWNLFCLLEQAYSLKDQTNDIIIAVCADSGYAVRVCFHINSLSLFLCDRFRFQHRDKCVRPLPLRSSSHIVLLLIASFLFPYLPLPNRGHITHMYGWKERGHNCKFMYIHLHRQNNGWNGS